MKVYDPCTARICSGCMIFWERQFMARDNSNDILVFFSAARECTSARMRRDPTQQVDGR